MDNLHGRITRKNAGDSLEDLTNKGHLTCKEYGKCKVYTLNQDKFPPTNPEELAELDETVEIKKSKLNGITDKLKAL